uniref:RRM domain-containing protein n=1 Tax=Brassica campestris TaxID=3711 RepID=M4FA77_BRACM
MRGRSYTPSPPRGGYGRRGRSPSPRGRYGGGRSSRDLPTSLLVRNLRHDCRQDDLRRSFEQFGPLKDIYLPRDYYTGGSTVPQHACCEVVHLRLHFCMRRSPPRYSRSPPRRRGRSRSRSGDYYSPPRRHHPRSISPRGERYDRGRSYSRSPAYNGSRGRSVTPARGKSRSISRSPRSTSRSPRGGGISPSPRRSISRSPSPRRSISRSPRGSRSPSPRRSRSYTPEQARSRSPPRGEQYEDRSPSQ